MVIIEETEAVQHILFSGLNIGLTNEVKHNLESLKGMLMDGCVHIYFYKWKLKDILSSREQMPGWSFMDTTLHRAWEAWEREISHIQRTVLLEANISISLTIWTAEYRTSDSVEFGSVAAVELDNPGSAEETRRLHVIMGIEGILQSACAY